MASLRPWLAETWASITQSPRSMAAASAALALGVGAGVVPERHIFDYLWRDPTFCGSCHVHDYANEAYDRSIHAGVTTCHDCHLVPIRHYPRNLWLMVFDRPQGPNDIHRPEIPTVVCTRCHSKEADHDPLTGPMPEEMRARIAKVDDSTLHRAHLSSETRVPKASHGGDPNDDPTARAPSGPELGLHIPQTSWDKGAIGCTDCHGSEANRAHQFTATRDACVACHKNTELHGGSMASADCRQCHLSGFVSSGAASARAGEATDAPSNGIQ